MLTLGDLHIGQDAIIRVVGGEGELRHHLLDMGLTPGTEVTLRKTAPMGDPIEVELRGYELTLRLADAQKIEIDSVHATDRAAPSEERHKVVAHPGVGELDKAASYHERKAGAPIAAGAPLTFALAGNQNCGKTTLLKAMAGLLEVQDGEILLDGENIFSRRFDRAVLRRKVGMVFQYPEYQLFAQTVEKDVGFGLKYSRLSREEKQERVRWALEQMGFSYEEIKDQSPLSLSGGEKRRVAIAGVLATKPELLMLDEPLAGLDPMAREMFLEFLEGLTGQGVSVVMVSHNVDALAQHAARIIGMKQGKIVMDGSCQEVLGDSRALRTIGLLGSEAAQTAELLRANGVLPGSGLPVTYEALRDEIIGALTGEKGENR